MINKSTRAQFFHGVKVVAEKNIKIYYTKPPVIIFGLLFPVFMFLSFYLGKKIDLIDFFPGLFAMFLFFISSSVGPLITPWEKSAGTHERLLSFPVTINSVILGDITAGMIFGILINLVLLTVGLIIFNYSLSIVILILGILLGSFCFSCLGVLLASPSVPNPSNIMMFSSLIRFPLIFISGIFIPLENLHGVGRILSYFSPVTYVVDIFNFSFKGKSYIFLPIDFSALFIFSLIFFFSANRFHKRNLIKGM